MSVTIELSRDDLQLLLRHVDRHLQHLDAELVRTDKHELQHDLALEVKRLQDIARRLSVASAA
ncbi:MAG TPA: hypothetical protein VFD92_03090 [Candidatus Binatia bacterium]|nr:hypothetical protein [Candidatus Binatia bacterium]